MSHIRQYMAIVMRQILPAGWELVDAEPFVQFRRDGDQGGLLAIGFHLRRVDTPTPINTEHLRRRGDPQPPINRQGL